jgi:hypothetical protein
MPGDVTGRSIREDESRENGSCVPWNEESSLVPVLERFLLFSDKYIQRFQIAANITAVAGKSVLTD